MGAAAARRTTLGKCVNVNSGQLLGVALTADRPADNYWITGAQTQQIGRACALARNRVAMGRAHA